MGNTSEQCRLGLFQDSDFAADLEDSKSTSGGTLCVFGSHTFVPISWMWRKQTSVSRSSTESEIISLDAGLRLDGFPALDLWDLIVAVLHGNKYQSNQERGNPCTNLVRAAPHKLQMRKKFHGQNDDLDNIDFISSNVHSSRQEALLYVFEDNEAVIKIIIKGRSPTMRHVSRTHRVALHCLMESFGPQIKYIDTKNQPADILTEGNFTRDERNHLLFLFNISHFSFTNCLEVMSKRTQEDAGEERVTAKSKPMMNLVSRCSVRDPDVLASTASESPGKTRYESQIPLSSWTEQQPRTGRPVMGASSSDYSEWNLDEKWSSQEWKSDEMLEARTERPVGGQPAGSFTQHTDRFVIDDDNMDSDTATESDLSLKSRSFLHRVNDRLRKILDQSLQNAMIDIDKHSFIWRRTVFNIGSICIHGKELLRKFQFHQKYREQSHV